MAEDAHEAVTRSGLNADPRSAFQGGSSIKYFEKKIEFVPARKPSSGLMYRGGDFKIETLNPGCADPSGGLGSVQEAVNGKVNKGHVSEVFDAWLDPELSLGVSFKRIVSPLSYNSLLIKVLSFSRRMFAHLIHYSQLFVFTFHWVKYLVLSIFFRCR